MSATRCEFCRFWVAGVAPETSSFGWCMNARQADKAIRSPVSGQSRKGNAGLETHVNARCAVFERREPGKFLDEE
jgi:hypothetical protein